MRRAAKALPKLVLMMVALGLLYVLLWPVPIDPVAWAAPADPGYTGAFAPNTRLAGLEILPLGGDHGPEEVVLDANGRIYAATHSGSIVRLDADGSNPQDWAHTGGRPLGIVFDADGNLIVADAFRGLLSIAPDASLTVLATVADGIPIVYADNVDVAADGLIYFSDASTRFNAKELGTYPASLLDLMEHRNSGRLLVYDPQTGQTSTLLDGLSFANGVALAHDQSFVLVNETGEYRVTRYWLRGPKKGQAEPLIESLPGFPDNLTRGLDGRFWLALVSPRNAFLDRMSNMPMMRNMVQRLPAAVRPQAVPYGHVMAIDRDGRVIADLQDPSGSYPLNTSVTETDDYLYVGSLVAPGIGRLRWNPAAG